MRKITLITLGTLLGLGLTAGAQQTFVVDSAGNRKPVDDISASPQGDLSMKVGEATLIMKRGQYQFVVSPKPKEVGTLEQLLAQNNNDAIVAAGEKVFQQYKYLGWGGHIAYLQASAFLRQGKAAEALKILQQATPPEIAARFEDEVTKGRISALIDLGKTAEATPLLAKIKASKDDKLAAFAFLANGKILEKEGKKKDAVLEYLKTTMLFKDGAADAEKQEAKQRVAVLLKELGDPRYKQFE